MAIYLVPSIVNAKNIYVEQTYAKITFFNDGMEEGFCMVHPKDFVESKK